MSDVMHDTSVTDPHGLVAAYALDAVDDIERATFERHLATCESCRNELSSYGPVLTGLGLMAEEQVPSRALRAGLMAAIASTPQESARTSSTPQADAEIVHQRGHHAAHAAPRARRRGLSLLAAAAAVVIVVGGGAVVVNQVTNRPTTSSTVAATGAERVLSARDAHSVSGTVSGRRVTFTVSRSQDAAAVDADSVSPLPSGHTYQLWFLDKAGHARSAGLLAKPGTQLMSGALGDATTAAITVEPSGGSKQPTSTPVVAVTLT